MVDGNGVAPSSITREDDEGEEEKEKEKREWDVDGSPWASRRRSGRRASARTIITRGGADVTKGRCPRLPMTMLTPRRVVRRPQVESLPRAGRPHAACGTKDADAIARFHVQPPRDPEAMTILTELLGGR